MTENQGQIKTLLEKLDTLLKRQEEFSKEIEILRAEIIKLGSGAKTSKESNTTLKAVHPPSQTEGKKTSLPNPDSVPTTYSSRQLKPKKPKTKSEIEKFIGENLINKIGIAITILGVAIGAKYSIDHDLISPLTRIILGYLVGIGLLGFGMKLKVKYGNFSAVLVSGSMAIMYFITFLAYDLYSLIPLFLTFGLMATFTAFTVAAAIKYNKQVIAHIGLVGAYAVPLLLGDGTGNVAILFSYIAVINIGILILSFKKYWKKLYYFAFGLTWIIYLSWYFFSYDIDRHFSLAGIFLILYFSIFYGTFISYKFLRNEEFKLGGIILLLFNSFIFFGVGYSILSSHETYEWLLGLFALGNSVIHFVISLIIYRKKLSDTNLFFLMSGLVLIFLTIAFPIQLDGNWVTLLWVGECALLFWIGRVKRVVVYEKIAYPLMLLAFLSLLQDWSMRHFIDYEGTLLIPLLNVDFLSTILFAGAFTFILYLHRHRNYPSALASDGILYKLVSFIIPGILLFSIYNGFRLEIEMYWDQRFASSQLDINKDGYTDTTSNYDLLRFKSIWVNNYSLLFIACLSYLNFKKLRSNLLGLVIFGASLLLFVLFLADSLYQFSELRQSYLDQTPAAYYKIDSFYLYIRYVSFLFFVLAMYVCHRYTLQEYFKRNIEIVMDSLLHISILWILSSELIHWMDIAGYSNNYKIGLSILWGSYSLLLISLGIWKKKAYLRVGAIVIFALTLLKLFLYDISHLDTIAKTIVFVSLGALLLIISFLYNKYKHIISDDDKG